MIVRLRPGCSDGDALHVPKDGGKYTQVVPPTPYLEKVGQQWMEARGEAQDGVKYILEALPSGYSMWQRPRPSDSRHVDKYLYGHPGHKPFDSPNRFYPHFQYLMENNRSSIGCPCTLCAGSAGILPPRSSSGSAKANSSRASSSRPSTTSGPKPAPATTSVLTFFQQSATRAPVVPAVRPAPRTLAPQAQAPAAQYKGRPKTVGVGLDSSRVDEEGTPDVYRNLVDKLKRYTTIDEIIQETLSPDWRAEQEILPALLQSLKQQEQWVPRVGDIVLYIRDMPSNIEILQHEVTEECQMYDEDTAEFLGSPPWEAGLVSEAPAEASDVASLYRTDSDTNVIYSGVRVEPLPDPNSNDKTLSKRHKYVPLRQIRPLVLWKELLHNVPQEEWHCTIINALTVTTTISLFGKFRFKGTWPNADIFCHGMHLGSEMLVVGDTVRLFPTSVRHHTHCMEVLVIKSIRLKCSDLDKASNNDYDEGRPYNSSAWIYGSGYTCDISQVNKEYLSEGNTEPPKATTDYGEWHPLHPATKELAVPFSRVMGRVYEREAMTFWLSSKPGNHPTLDNGREALSEARAYAREHDQRVTQNSGTWYWGDSRADALNLHTVNGLEITKYDQERDIRDLRKKVKVIEDMENGKPATGKSITAQPLASRGLRRHMAPGTADSPVQTDAAQGTSTSSSVAGSSSTGASSSANRKRPHIINLSDDEDGVRQNTRVVEDGTNIGKKPRVAVLIR